MCVNFKNSLKMSWNPRKEGILGQENPTLSHIYEATSLNGIRNKVLNQVTLEINDHCKTKGTIHNYCTLADKAFPHKYTD